jgi:hypothetical protein
VAAAAAAARAPASRTPSRPPPEPGAAERLAAAAPMPAGAHPPRAGCARGARSRRMVRHGKLRIRSTLRCAVKGVRAGAPARGCAAAHSTCMLPLPIGVRAALGRCGPAGARRAAPSCCAPRQRWRWTPGAQPGRRRGRRRRGGLDAAGGGGGVRGAAPGGRRGRGRRRRERRWRAGTALVAAGCASGRDVQAPMCAAARHCERTRWASLARMTGHFPKGMLLSVRWVRAAGLVRAPCTERPRPAQPTSWR